MFLSDVNGNSDGRRGFLLSKAGSSSAVHVVSVGAQWIEIAIVVNVD